MQQVEEPSFEKSIRCTDDALNDSRTEDGDCAGIGLEELPDGRKQVRLLLRVRLSIERSLEDLQGVTRVRGHNSADNKRPGNVEERVEEALNRDSGKYRLASRCTQRTGDAPSGVLIPLNRNDMVLIPFRPAFTAR